MKKLFILLFATTALFTSCSSDDDNFAQTEPNLTAKTYPVELNIRSNVFNVDKTPLTKSTSFGEAQFLQVIAYKESGEVYSDSIIYKEDLQTLIKGDSAVSFNLNLPEGNYNLAVFSIGNRYGINNYETSIEYPIGPINPKNYNTDEYRLPSTVIMGYPQNNSGLYYFTSNLSVSAKENNSLDNVVLEPMWSDVKITLTDLKSENTPTGTYYISVGFNPSYLGGFNIKTKLALDQLKIGFPSGTGSPQSEYYNFQLIENKDLSNEVTLNYVAAKGENSDMSILVEYIESNNTLQQFIVIGSQEFKFENKFENGYTYNLNGKLDAVNNGQSMNISLGEFNKEDVVINF